MSARKEIITYIIKYIQKNHLEENDKILSENRLTEIFNVNRNVVRSALSVLKAQGFIYSQKGKGCFVSQKQKPLLYRYESDLGFSEIIDKTKNEFTYKVIDIKKGFPSVKEKSVLKLNDEDEVYYLKQLRSVSGTEIAVCLSVIPEKKVPELEKHIGSFVGTNNIFVNAYNYPHPYCKSIKISAVVPTVDETILLNIPENLPLLKQEELFYINDTDPIEYFIVIARGDIFRFSINF